jgi:hypothetical protein
MSWIRKSFESVGLTQVPAGPHLRKLQKQRGAGTVMLLLDISGSMQDPMLSVIPGQAPIHEAVIGARRFVDEAVEAGYRVGIILWHAGIGAERLPTEDGRPAYELLDGGNFPRGGTDLYPAACRAHEILAPYVGDRVVAIFGDGALGNQAGFALREIEEMKRENIRFVTRGLGDVAADAFAAISDEAPEETRVDSVDDLADGIAGMATALRMPATR